MPTLNIGDIQIQVETAQKTSPSLKVMDSSGQIYYISAAARECPDSLKIYDGMTTYSIGDWRLHYDAASVNTCQTIELPPGCYHAEVLGGAGGDGGNNPDSGAPAIAATYDFVIDAPTSAYVFLGGNGNTGGVNKNENLASGGGGGASGLASFIVINGVVTTSDGGAGGIGGSGTDAGGTSNDCGAGGGGNAGENANGLDGAVSAGVGNNAFVCAAGGGGAPDGLGGKSTSGALMTANAGEYARNESGGAGGYAKNSSWRADGGSGGQTVRYSCAGYTTYSYGGGGGGGVNGLGFGGIGSKNITGGAGGSGVSDETAGYVRIYRFG